MSDENPAGATPSEPIDEWLAFSEQDVEGGPRRTLNHPVVYLAVVIGVAILIGSQVFVNTAITVGLLPIAGLTLPFMSYGGSSLLSSFAAIALVLDVGARRIQVFGR